jgi:hypothetical protein
MIEEQCSSCKYKRGKECRFKTPVIFNFYERAYWPIVHEEDWCRMWEYNGICKHHDIEQFSMPTGSFDFTTINRCKRCGENVP